MNLVKKVKGKNGRGEEDEEKAKRGKKAGCIENGKKWE
jgi:hypothetical protein